MYLEVSEDASVSQDHDYKNSIFKAVNSLQSIPHIEFYFIPQ